MQVKRRERRRVNPNQRRDRKRDIEKVYLLSPDYILGCKERERERESNTSAVMQLGDIFTRSARARLIEKDYISLQTLLVFFTNKDFCAFLIKYSFKHLVSINLKVVNIPRSNFPTKKNGTNTLSSHVAIIQKNCTETENFGNNTPIIIIIDC